MIMHRSRGEQLEGSRVTPGSSSESLEVRRAIAGNLLGSGVRDRLILRACRAGMTDGRAVAAFFAAERPTDGEVFAAAWVGIGYTRNPGTISTMT